ncbi:MAG: hypothetical protein IJQ25_06085 [Oscillibacter sp.]|nr:hypothetical protein [Oscillibacter sp.]
MKKTFGVVGGGERAAELVRLLRADGHTVYGADLPEQALGADVVVLPVPLVDASGRIAGLSPEEALSRFRAGQYLFAGLVPDEIATEARRLGLSLTDYMKHEPLAIANAAATADAALCLTLTHTRESVSGRRCLVLGFGRIGKLLCHRLRGTGAEVTAAARNPDDRAWIRALGMRAVDVSRLAGELRTFPIVYNTIPAPVLDSELLRELPPDCFLMDLASKPCTASAVPPGVSYLWARGLPGRVVPRGAAAILRDTVYELLRELR